MALLEMTLETGLENKVLEKKALEKRVLKKKVLE